MYTIFRGGYNSRHPRDYKMIRPKGLYCYLFLIIRSPAYIQIGAEKFTVLANSAVIIKPHVPYWYSGIDGEYRNDWLYFEPSDEHFEEEYDPIMNHPILLSDALHYAQFFKNIVWENNYAMEKYRRQNASMLLAVMLNKLMQENQVIAETGAYNPYASKLQELRLSMLSRPDKNYTPTELSAMLNVSPSYFQALYREFFGMPFKTDLIQMRLDYARDLICETDLTLEQIARMSGYNNEIHFYRQFKAKSGMTPKEYRTAMNRENCIIYDPHDIPR